MKIFDKNVRVEVGEQPIVEQPKQISEEEQIEVQIRAMQEKLMQKKLAQHQLTERNEQIAQQQPEPIQTQDSMMDYFNQMSHQKKDYIQQPSPQQMNAGRVKTDDKLRFKQFSWPTKVFIIAGFVSFFIWLAFILLIIFGNNMLAAGA